jgi:hypothetical protein
MEVSFILFVCDGPFVEYNGIRSIKISLIKKCRNNIMGPSYMFAVLHLKCKYGLVHLVDLN